MLNLIPLLAAFEPPEVEMLKNAPKSSNPQIFGTDITVILAVLLGIREASSSCAASRRTRAARWLFNGPARVATSPMPLQVGAAANAGLTIHLNGDAIPP